MNRHPIIFWIICILVVALLAGCTLTITPPDETVVGDTAQRGGPVLDETGILTEIGYTIDYPAGWFWVQCDPGASFGEVESEANQFCNGPVIPTGNLVGFDYRDMTFMQSIGLPADPTLDDLLALNTEVFGYIEPEITETTVFGEPALRVRNLANGVPTIEIMGFHDGHVFLLGFQAEDGEALDAFVPTIEVVLASLQVVEAN